MRETGVMGFHPTQQAWCAGQLRRRREVIRGGRIRRHGRSPGRWLGGVLLAALVAILATGCTAIPGQDLAAYRQAFAEARQASTPIIDDLRVTWHDAAAALPEPRPEAGDPLLRPFRSDEPTIDEQVMVRHQLWIVVDRYNDALAAIAEGKTSEQAEGAVSGFLESVHRLPIQALAGLAAAGQPLAAVIGESLRVIDRAVRARRFRDAVLAGGPIVDAILEAMQEEIDDLYDLRLGVSADRRLALELPLVLPDGATGQFTTLYAQTGPHPKKDELLHAVNEALRAGFWFEQDQLLDPEDDPDAEPLATEELAQLMTLATQIQDAGAKAAAINEEMLAYREALLTYAELLSIVQRRMNDLLAAVDEGVSVNANDVLLQAAALHWQFTRYRDARANQ